MSDWTIREYGEKDFAALFALDTAVFEPGIAYSKWMLKQFLNLESADCLVAVEGGKIVGFVLAEENPPIGHIITLDVAESMRRKGLGSALIGEIEGRMKFRGVRSVLLETSVENLGGIAFWERHGYRTEAVLKRYYLRRVDALEMRKRI
jgi:[ribosomal protein S18]-alanine N-acetyltransferase